MEIHFCPHFNKLLQKFVINIDHLNIFSRKVVDKNIFFLYSW